MTRQFVHVNVITMGGENSTLEHMQEGIDCFPTYITDLDLGIDSHLEGMHVPDLLGLVCWWYLAVHPGIRPLAEREKWEVVIQELHPTKKQTQQIYEFFSWIKKTEKMTLAGSSDKFGRWQS